MRNTLILFLVLTTAAVKAQRDSSSHVHKNVVSVELGGGSFRLFRYGNPFNLGYHRLVYFKSNEHVQLEFRLGVSYFTTSTSPPKVVHRSVLFPSEVEVLFGYKYMKVELGLGYTPIFGEQRFQAYDSDGDEFTYSTKFYHFFTGRLGLCFMPVRVFPVFIRIAWTPAYVLPPCEVPLLETDDNAAWASLTLGFSF